MKIRIWAFVLIVAGAFVVGGAIGFSVFGGFTAADKVLQDLTQSQPSVSVQAPNSNNNNNNNNSNGSNGRFRQLMPGNGSGNGGYTIEPAAPPLPSGLPQGFNAGVNIESEYATLTSRTVAQVQSAEQQANTDVWGLAQQEGKLDQLKAKVTDDVTSSLKQMVSSGKITQSQSDSYLNWVKQYLQTIGQTTNSGVNVPMPGSGRGFPGGNWYFQPGSTAEPNSTAAPAA